VNMLLQTVRLGILLASLALVVAARPLDGYSILKQYRFAGNVPDQRALQKTLTIARARLEGLNLNGVASSGDASLLLNFKGEVSDVERLLPFVVMQGNFEVSFKAFDPRTNRFRNCNLIDLLGRSLTCNEHVSHPGPNTIFRDAYASDERELTLELDVKDDCLPVDYPSSDLSFSMDDVVIGSAAFVGNVDPERSHSLVPVASSFHRSKVVVSNLTNPKEIAVVLNSGIYPARFNK